MIQAVIFDIGGVLADDVWEHLLLDERRGIAALNNLPREEVASFGRELWQEFAYIPETVDRDWMALEHAYWMKFKERFGLTQPLSFFTEQTERFIKPVEGMADLLAHLKAADMELAICSNNTEFWLKRQIDKLELQRFFETEKIVSSCKVGASKSSPNFEMFREVITALGGISPSACIFVDDRSGNVERAIEFGMNAILFPPVSEHGSTYLRRLLENMNIFE